MSSISKGQASAGLVEDESATDGPGDSNDEAIREENEQWERTWDILMSMISKVIPYARRPTGTGDERRSDLIAAVGKLIQSCDFLCHYRRIPERQYQKSGAKL